MTYKVHGIWVPERFANSRRLPAGFFTPCYTSPYAEIGLVPLINWDVITDLIAAPVGVPIGFDSRDMLGGASQTLIGDEAQYAFVDPRTRKPYTASRTLLVHHVEDWLNSKGSDDNEQVYAQAKVFCDGKLPKLILTQQQELEAGLNAIRQRGH